MKIPIKANITYAEAGITVGTIFLLTIFCHLAKFTLIIPLLLLFFGIHLFLFKKASLKLFINLGLLLTLVVFVFRFSVGYPIDFMLLALLTILIVLDYYDTNPTERKSNKILLGGIVGFCAFFALGLIDNEFIKSSPFFAIPQKKEMSNPF